MQFKVSEHVRKVLAFVLVASFVAVALSLSPGAASASSPRSGELHVTKECSEYTGAAGDFCTITSSNLKAIAVGSKIVYASALVGPLLNSNVVLEVRPGNTAFGHCTIDLSATPNGVCTFSGGTGQFIHFQASVVVSHLGTVNYAWDGTYSFSPRD